MVAAKPGCVVPANLGDNANSAIQNNVTKNRRHYCQLLFSFMSLETTWTGPAGHALIRSHDALAYFVQPNANPFYDLAANNHRASTSAVLQEGLHFALEHSQPASDASPLHIIKKMYTPRAKPG